MQIAPFSTPSVAPVRTAAPVSGPKLQSDALLEQTPETTVPVGPGKMDPMVFAKAADRVMQADSSARIVRDATSNSASFISGAFSVSPKPEIGQGADRLARSFLFEHGEVFGLKNQAEQLKLVSTETDDLGFNHFKFQQMQDGLPVFGQQLVVHMKNSKVESVGGRITPNLVSGTTPSIDGTEAARRGVALAIDLRQKDGLPAEGLTATGEQQLGWYTRANGQPALAYQVNVGGLPDAGWTMFVDAKSGKVIEKMATVHSVMNRETIDVKTKKKLTEGSAPSGDKPLDAAHDNAKDVYDFFMDRYGRDSIDGKGMKLVSNVHYGNRYNNAFWNGTSMTYGDGDGKQFIPFSLAADVVAHEMTHGVTERSAGLQYYAQSGALNESWSDVFGNFVEKWGEKRAGKPEADPAWRIGEDIFTPDVDGDALRSMSSPGTGYKGDTQPAHMKDYKKMSSDNGGVHINSGIPNKAAYEAVMTIGQDKVSDVWYRALTKYLTPTSQFADAANVTVQSAIDLYGAGSVEANAIARAWEGVGLTPSVKPGIVS